MAVTGLRFVLAVVLLTTGAGKLLDLRGFAEIVTTYEVIPDALALPAGLALTLTELGVGVWLLSGKHLALAGLVAAALHLAYFGWSGLALLRGLDIKNCGCFGVFLARPLTPLTLVEDGVLFFAALYIWFGARRAGRLVAGSEP